MTKSKRRKKNPEVHVYLPRYLIRKIEQLARRECRSMTQQVVYMLLRILKVRSKKES